MVTLESNFTW